MRCFCGRRDADAEWARDEGPAAAAVALKERSAKDCLPSRPVPCRPADGLGAMGDDNRKASSSAAASPPNALSIDRAALILLRVKRVFRKKKQQRNKDKT